MKRCPSCKIQKHYNNYYTNKTRSDGVDVYCIECRKTEQKEKQQKKIEQRLQEQYIENEIWKDIIGFNNYECSTEGRIRNKITKQLLKQSKCCSGYGVSSIRGKNIKFHRIIAQTFLPNFENKPTVEHKDDNKLNNRLYNLKWATVREQAQYIIDKGSRKTKFGVKIGTNNLDNLENECWKIIIDYPEYEISNMGRIKYPIRKGEKPYRNRITYGGISGDGYKTFGLRDNDTIKKIAIHRLVADAFITNINNYKIVNHKDGNKLNNKIDNLEWCSRSQNTKHAYDNDLISGKRKIYQLDINNNIIKEYDTIKDAYENLKLGRTAINSVLSGRNKTSGGYYWCYKEDYNNTIKRHTMYDTNKISIKQICIKSNNLIKIWDSLSDASNFIATNNKSSFKAVKSNISQCIRGKRNSCQGFKWEYN